MKLSSSRFILLAFVVAACGAPATTATVPAPATRTATATTTTTKVSSAAPSVHVTAPAVSLVEPPSDWQLLDESADHIPGISVRRAMKELLAGQSPKHTVLVAIIDNGIDTAHVDLKANIWVNPKEIPGNNVDDDKNGYVDDIHGWNFLGGKSGQDVHFDTFEVTRQYAACHGLPAAAGQAPITDADKCKQIDADFQKQRDQINKELETYRSINEAYQHIVPMLEHAASTDSLTAARVKAVQSTAPDTARAREIYLDLASEGASPSLIAEQLKSLEGQANYSLNPQFNSRTIVGDDYPDWHQRNYGNNDVMGQDAGHGTHVAGIIGAVQNNGIGIDGIAPAVRLMMIRTVPDGDEHDKDIGNAIRYAVDNGAQIISMSFGKPYSPYKEAVDEAVKYADEHGVLMVHAAGNDGEDLAKGKNFPTPVYLDGGKPIDWIEVGASSWKGGDSLAASFSNYGKNEVDVFAPGVDILSTVPNNKYQRDSGTSMAAPVVTGLAALIMAYYPNLSASDVKRIITSSVSNYSDQMVVRPGSSDHVPFGTLSITGGIVNAYNALKLAGEVASGHAQP